MRFRIAHMLFLGLLLTPATAAAQTAVPAGTLGASETWTAAGSPYLIAGDVVVPIGGSLTIEAGAELRFSTTDAAAGGTDLAKSELIVDGSLSVNGSAASPVLFRADGASAAGAWEGIVVRTDATSVRIEHADIRYADTGVSSAPITGITSVLDSHFETCAFYAISAADGELRVSGLSATDTGQGIYVNRDAFATIEGALIWNQDGNCVSVQMDFTTPGDTEIRGSTFHNCYNGVSRTGTSPRVVRVLDSLITGHRNYGVSGVEIYTSDIWGNARASSFTGSGNFGLDPLYVRDPMNLRLTAFSPARNAGSAGQDLGALPYAGDPSPGLYGTLHDDLTLPAGDHTLEGDFVIAPGATLTIEPGARLLFPLGDVMQSGAQDERVELVVRGSLVAVGTRAAPIRFESPTVGLGQWFGIRALASSSVTLREVEIRYVFRGVGLEGPGSHDLDGLYVEQAFWGAIGVLEGEHTVRRLHAVNTEFGVRVENPAAISLHNALIENQDSSCVFVQQDLVTPASSEVFHATLTGCSLGINYSQRGGTRRLRVRNTLITGNVSAGFSASGDGATHLDVSYTDSWGNGASDFPAGFESAEGNRSEDPLYVDLGSDFHLAPGSPVVDAADPSFGVLVDLEGTVRPLDGDGDGEALPDIGAYELVGMVACGNGALEEGEECDDGNIVDGDGCDSGCRIEEAPPDAGVETDAGIETDAGVETDAGSGSPDASTSSDGGMSERDAGETTGPSDPGGCSCRASGSAQRSTPWGFLLIAFVIWRRRRALRRS